MYYRLFHYNIPLQADIWNRHTLYTRAVGFLLSDDFQDHVTDGTTVSMGLAVRLLAPWSFIDPTGMLIYSDEDAVIPVVDGLDQDVYLQIEHRATSTEPWLTWVSVPTGTPPSGSYDFLRLFRLDLSSGAPHTSVDVTQIDWNVIEVSETSYRRIWRGIVDTDASLPSKPLEGDTWIVRADWSIRVWDGTTWQIIGSGGGGGGTTDHGALTGLADDDHPQYSLVNGTRDYTGKVRGVSTSSSDPGTTLVTKDYVDSHMQESVTGDRFSRWYFLYGDLDVTSSSSIEYLKDRDGNEIPLPTDGDLYVSVWVLASSLTGEGSSGTPAQASFRGSYLVHMESGTFSVNGALSQEVATDYVYGVDPSDFQVNLVEDNPGELSIEVRSSANGRVFKLAAKVDIVGRQ